MTAVPFDYALPARRSLFGAEPVFAAAGLLIGLSLAVTLAAMAIDVRLFQGESVWVKPVKFQVALTLYLLTLAFFARWLPEGMVARRSYRVYAGVVVFAIVSELAWIIGAAMYGTGSHFNIGAPVMARLYSLMGVLAVILTSASLVYGIAIWRNRATGLPPALHLAIALGLVLTFALTLPVASTMANLPGHFVGSPVSGAHVPVMGWSREVGDLRLAQFFATHPMHFLPLAGLAAAVLLPARAGRLAVWGAAALYVAFVAWAFTGALAGQPLMPLG
jgi:hypothetical protein